MHFSTLHLRAIQQFQQERFIAGAAFNDNDTLAQRPLQPGKRFLSVLSVGDDLGDHRIELCGDRIAFRHAGVNPHSRPGQDPEPLDRARGGRKTVVGILSIQPYFDGVAGGPRWFAFQVSAARDVNLQLDQIEPGGAFGHRMLDLQPRVHLHEKESPLFRLVQEFHRAGVAVARGLAQAYRCFAQSLILFGRKRRRRRFLKNLLVAALNGAVAHPACPGCSMVVGDDLHLNVARSPLNELLHENGRVAKGLECFGASALESFWKLAGLTNPANSVTPTPSGGLNKEWVAQVFRVVFGVGERLYRAVAPGGYLDLLLLGQAFRRDLIAHAPHHIAIGADEHDAHFMAKVRERGVLSHEAPSYPDRIGARGRQRSLQAGIIHITALELPGVLIESPERGRDTPLRPLRGQTWHAGPVQ